MKIKKEYLGKIIFKGRTKIQLSEIVDDRTMRILKAEFPQFVEEEKPKKKKDATSKK